MATFWGHALTSYRESYKSHIWHPNNFTNVQRKRSLNGGLILSVSVDNAMFFPANILHKKHIIRKYGSKDEFM